MSRRYSDRVRDELAVVAAIAGDDLDPQRARRIAARVLAPIGSIPPGEVRAGLLVDAMRVLSAAHLAPVLAAFCDGLRERGLPVPSVRTEGAR